MRVSCFGIVGIIVVALATPIGAQPISTSTQGTIGSGVGSVSFGPPQPNLPTGTISGTVLDENGAPVSGVMVQAWFEVTMPDGNRRQMGGSSRSTDQAGHFMLERLQPGEYIVAVVPGMGQYAYAQAVQNTYAVTYFPGVTDPAQAQHIAAVDAGAKPITIRVQHASTFHVRGTVTSASGRSPAGLAIQLSQKIFNNTYARANSVVRPDGTFDLGGVVSGAYTVSTRVGYGEASTDFAVADIKIDGRDLDGVRLSLTSGGTIRGRLVLDKPQRGAAPLGLAVQMMPGNASQMGNMIGRMSGSIAVAGDWTFETHGLYGQYRFSLQTQGLPDYALVRTVLDGRDIGNALDVSITGGTHELVFYLAHR